MQQLLTAKTLADYLGLAEQTIYNRHSSGGDLPRPLKLGPLLRFHPSDVDVWLEDKRQSRQSKNFQPRQLSPTTLNPPSLD
jgi:predicted DNA-binding transcriptional regulator AlpA